MTIKKTYKLFIGGKFPRTESGRVLEVRGKNGDLLANMCRAGRKDFREAVVVARKAQPGWAKASAYLKGQILYRIAEVLDGRRAQFEAELSAGGLTAARARNEVDQAIDLFVHYAGWTDKFQALFSTVNPVASSHFNFSVPEPSGVVGVVAPSDGSLAGLASVIAPAIAGGNSIIALVSPSCLSAITFAEVLATSDVPGGVVNILTGKRDELVPEFAKHMDVNGVVLCSDDSEERKALDLESAENLKRTIHHADGALKKSPYHILDLQEIKTTWHPVGV